MKGPKGFDSSGAEIVHHSNGVTLGEERLDEVRTDEPGTPGDRDDLRHSTSCEKRANGETRRPPERNLERFGSDGRRVNPAL